MLLQMMPIPLSLLFEEKSNIKINACNVMISGGYPLIVIEHKRMSVVLVCYKYRGSYHGSYSLNLHQRGACGPAVKGRPDTATEKELFDEYKKWFLEYLRKPENADETKIKNMLEKFTYEDALKVKAHYNGKPFNKYL